MGETETEKRIVFIEKQPEKLVNKGTTIDVPPMEIHCIMEEDFESKPLWKIILKDGLGYWPKESKGEWKKEDFKDNPRLEGEFMEIECAEKKEGDNHYVLVKNNEDEVWINVGKIKPEEEQGDGYELKYEYAKQVRKSQYGIRGTAKVTYKDNTLEFKLMAVRAKTRSDGPMTGNKRIGTKSTPRTLVGPGLYRGLVTPRKTKKEKYGNDALFKHPCIHLTAQWEADQREDGEWVEGVKKKSSERSKNIFIHPAHIPDWLDGCLALCGKDTEWKEYGFESNGKSEEAMKEIFKLLDITTKEQFTKVQNLDWNKKPKVIITMTDKRPGSTDKATLRIRLQIDPADSKNADDTFTLYSTGGSYRKILTVKDDSKPGDKFVDLVYDGIDRSLSYTLEVDTWADSEKYFFFEDLPYSQIVTLKKGS